MAGLALGCQFVVGKRQTNAICGILKLTFCCLIWRQKRENSVSLSLSVDGIGEKRTNWTTTHISMLDSTCPRMQQTFLIRDMLTNKTFFTEKREEKKETISQTSRRHNDIFLLRSRYFALLNQYWNPPSLFFAVSCSNRKWEARRRISDWSPPSLLLLGDKLANICLIDDGKTRHLYVRTYVRTSYVQCGS